MRLPAGKWWLIVTLVLSTAVVAGGVYCWLYRLTDEIPSVESLFR